MRKQKYDEPLFRISLDKSVNMANKGFHYHIHPTLFEALYVVSGDVESQIAGMVYNLKPDTLLLVKPGVPHSASVKSNEPYIRYVMHFSEKLINNELRQYLEFPGGYILYDCGNFGAKNAVPMLLNLLTAYSEELDKEDKCRSVLLESILVNCNLLDNPKEDTFKYVPRFIEATFIQKKLVDLMDYIDMHFTEHITLDMLCNKFSISKSQINRMFKEKTDTTAMKYIISKRISYAHTLQASGVSCIDSAIKAGFSDYSSFYRAYMRRFGVAPSNQKGGAKKI